MHWEIMKSEYDKGIRVYNMGGVNTDPESPSYGVYQWKREYGGGIRGLSVLSKEIIPLLSKLRSIKSTRD
jgi:lipid II:glycine glycyltransferase (peptidoglycan interpeptide bridge formation enzyme)